MNLIPYSDSNKRPENPQHAVLSLGANIGDPTGQIQQAIKHIGQATEVELLLASDLYQTKAWGKINQPDFINACVLIKTTLSPRALLNTCLSIEQSMGRIRQEKWGPRIIDLDILSYGDFQIRETDLEIPHPRQKERSFLKAPLRDLGLFQS